MKQIRYLLFFSIFAGSVTNAAGAEPLPRHFSKVASGIYRGARPSPSDLVTISRMGIETDIDLQGGDLIDFKYRDIVKRFEPGELPQAITAENRIASANNLNFINTPLDSLDPISMAEDKEIDRLLTLLNSATDEQPIFIHCEHGQDRTGLIIALYRVEHDNWTPLRAYKEWESFGHDELHELLTDDLDSYFAIKSKKLRRKAAQSPIKYKHVVTSQISLPRLK